MKSICFATKMICSAKQQILITSFVFIFVSLVVAQTSGGPYGSVVKSYEIPETSGRIFYVAVDGKKEQTGKDLSVPKTIESAIADAKTGDVIILRVVTYRTGKLVFNQEIFTALWEQSLECTQHRLESRAAVKHILIGWNIPAWTELPTKINR